MGQGQEYHARKMIMESMAGGGWVLLQNVHLSLPFCSEVIDMLVETEYIDESFRMWVTTEPHNEFPIGLLQMALKFTNEPPQGIRASLKRSYQVMHSAFISNVYWIIFSQYPSSHMCFSECSEYISIGYSPLPD